MSCPYRNDHDIACDDASEHVHCAICSTRLNVLGVCPHHEEDGPDWAVANRIFCDFIHREKPFPPRLEVPSDDSGVEVTEYVDVW